MHVTLILYDGVLLREAGVLPCDTNLFDRITMAFRISHIMEWGVVYMDGLEGRGEER